MSYTYQNFGTRPTITTLDNTWWLYVFNTGTIADGKITPVNFLNAMNTTLIGQLLTAFSAGAGTVTASDSIFTAMQKLAGNQALYAPIASPTFTGVATAPQFASNVTTGTAPFTVASTTRVTNLNAATSGNADTVTTITASQVTSSLLTGFLSNAGTVLATDTVLEGFNKLAGNGALYALGATTVNGQPLSGNITITASGLGALVASNNLSDLASASTARTNLGLGSAATQNSGAFDAAGSATNAENNAITISEAYTSSSISALNLGEMSTKTVANTVNVKTTAPSVSDDSSQSYYAGSHWLNSVTNEEYICTDASVGAAVWIVIKAGSTLLAVASAGGTTTLASNCATIQELDGVLNQTYVLPNATTLGLGYTRFFYNNSTGNMIITDNASGAVTTLGSGARLMLVLNSNSTAAGNWESSVLSPYTTSWNASGLTNTGFISTTSGVFTAPSNTDVVLKAAGTGLPGFVNSGSFKSTLDISDVTADRVIYAPNADSTLVIPAVAASGYAIDEIKADGTIGQVKLFTSSSAMVYNLIDQSVSPLTTNANIILSNASFATTDATITVDTVNDEIDVPAGNNYWCECSCNITLAPSAQVQLQWGATNATSVDADTYTFINPSAVLDATYTQNVIGLVRGTGASANIYLNTVTIVGSVTMNSDSTLKITKC